MDFPTTLVREGAASLRVPEITEREGEPLEQARSRSPVFFNPRMRLNRDSAVLALGVHQRRVSRPLTVCEPMCGTGVRGIRLALETSGVERVVMGDMNSSAVRLAQENARLNGVSDRVSVRLMEANLILSLHSKPLSRFDYVDVDPDGDGHGPPVRREPEGVPTEIRRAPPQDRVLPRISLEARRRGSCGQSRYA